MSVLIKGMNALPKDEGVLVVRHDDNGKTYIKYAVMCGGRIMYYVNPSEVMRLFKKYLEEYKDMLSKEQAINELQDALDSAECQWVEVEE